MPPGRTLPPGFSADTDHMLRPSEALREGGLPPHAERSSVGAFVGVVIIILLLAFGALYFWGAYLNQQETEDVSPTPSRSA